MLLQVSWRLITISPDYELNIQLSGLFVFNINAIFVKLFFKKMLNYG